MSHRIESQPLTVFHDLEDNEPGAAFTEWPLHFTVVPSFILDSADESCALDVVREVSSAIGSFKLELGEQAMYGPEEDVPVTEIYDTEDSLRRLHTDLITSLGAVGCHFKNLAYAFADYSPHITHKQGVSLPEPTFVCGALSVARLMPRPIKPNKVIVEKLGLDKARDVVSK